MSSDEALPTSAGSMHAARAIQFLGLERLGQIIVGAGSEAATLSDQLSRASIPAPASSSPPCATVEHGEAVDLGQAEIENHRVIILVEPR